METSQERAFGNAAIPLIAAVFLNEKSAGDAIADLNLSGFPAADVGVAVSPEDMKGQPSGRDKSQAPENLQKEHSIFWKFRHAHANDMQRTGPVLSSREDEQVAKERPSYTVLDLVETLQARGLPEDTVHLVCREVGAEGLLVLVKAGKSSTKVEALLERNGGYIRTPMVSEEPRVQI
jgi:hypothetical protein